MACVDCGRWCPSGWWQAPATADRCGKVQCMACGTMRCHGEGTSRGQCKGCLYGRLPGWSFSSSPATCMYKGCNAPCVYSSLPGSKTDCCKQHGDSIIAREQSKREVRMRTALRRGLK